MAQRGRPRGLLINPPAARHILGDRPQRWLAREAGITTAHISAIMAGTQRAGADVAERIADALDCEVEVLFPERTGFDVTVFTVNGESLT